MLAKIMTEKQESSFSAMNANCQQTWWHLTAERTSKLGDFMMFLAWGKGECKCKTKPF